ncbi:RHS repeat-associated core domain-containing protein [Microbulbifer thermotolerans]|uniref:RHS repeat-associated core domain-containing protein n=1 Tax=Microbulbifer thermotolerans TaxID=252514 RepID=UPI00267366ED|nr:RHS repeat-associated core domain-containing protein [Microbulbifer thermotolerans]WKT59635.1 RHS repeat-associated core domain-containing protein [Microbulbifer thermotolerans]
MLLVGASARGRLLVYKRWITSVSTVVSLALLVLTSGTYAKPGISSDGAQPRAVSSENMEDLEDMQVKVLGGYVRMIRRWTRNGWEWNSRWNPILTYDQLKAQASEEEQQASGQQATASGCQQPYEFYLFRNGQSYRPEKFRSDLNSCITPDGDGYHALLNQTLTKSGEDYTWRDKKGNLIFYKEGKLSYYEDKNGVRVSLEYEGDRIVRVKDHFGNTVIRYHWEQVENQVNGDAVLSYRLISLEDYSGRQVVYKYGENAADPLSYQQLVEVIDVRGKSWVYQYQSLSNNKLALKSVTDPNGRITTYSTNADGHINGYETQDGTGVTYSHSAEDQVYKATQRDRSGVVTETWHNVMGMPIKQLIGGELQYEIEYQYSGNKTAKDLAEQYRYTGSTQLAANANEAPVRIISSVTTDARGLKTKHFYDTFRNVTRTENPDGTYTTTEWNTELTLPLRERDERGVITEYEYDERGNLITLIEAAGTSDQRITRYTYDQYGQMLSESTGESTADNTEIAITRWEYDDFGNVTKVIDPEGNVTEYRDYDVNGNAHTIVDARGKTWTRDYDAVGNLLSDLNPYGQGFHYEYDAAGDLIKVTDASGSSLHITNNASGLPVTVTDDKGNKLALTYDKGNRLVTITDAEGASIRLEYNSQNKLSAIVDGEQNRTEYSYQQNLLSKVKNPTYEEELGYDKRNRLVQSRQKANNLEYLRAYGYDLSNNLISDTDALQNTEKYEYDHLNRLVAIIDPVNGETKKTEFTYDARDNLLQVKDPEGRLTVYTYDKNDRLKTETKHDFIGTSKQRVYDYDANGNLIAVTNPQQEKRVYSYDDANRLIRLQVYAHKDNPQPVKVVDYHYNAKAQYTGYTQTPGPDTANATADIVHHSETYTYDSLNRLASVRVDYYGQGDQAEEIAFSKSYSYTYYGNGLKKTYTNPEGITYTYYYNKNNQLAAVHIPGEGQLAWTDFHWLAPQTLLLPGGNRITLSYDDFLRVKERILEDSAGNNKARAVYEYDLESNIRKITSEHGEYIFSYDNLYRLTEADYPLGNAANDERFGYDGVGNRTEHAERADSSNGMEFNLSVSQSSYNNQNQLTAISGDSLASFEYNDNGHTSRKVQDGITWDYQYNHEERLIAVVKNGVTVGSYQYNPYGQRIRKQAGETTYFLYNEEGLAAEYDTAGNLIREYDFKPGMPWMTEPLFQRAASGELYYYQNDHLGTPQRMLDKSGAVVWEARYSAFGKAEVLVEIVGNNLRFPGQYFDGESGLHQNYMRDYDAEAGRYLQADPLGLESALNYYAYAYNNPNGFIDPTGEFVPLVFAYGRCVLQCMFMKWMGSAAQNLMGDPCADFDLAASAGECAFGCLNPLNWFKGKFSVKKSEARWNNGWRTDDGKFASPNGLERAGAAAEQKVWDAVKKKPGWSIIEGRVSVRNADGQLRVYDGAAVSPRGRIIGLEVKSGSARKTAAQRNFDSGVNTNNPAVGVGKSRGINVGRSLEIRVP